MVLTLWPLVPKLAARRAASSIVLVLLLTPTAAAQPPASSAPPSPPGLLGKLGQKTKSLFSRSPAPPTQPATQANPVKHATWNQPAPSPVGGKSGKSKRPAASGPKSGKRPRTMSEFMAQERP